MPTVNPTPQEWNGWRNANVPITMRQLDFWLLLRLLPDGSEESTHAPGPQTFVCMALVLSHQPSHIPSCTYINEHWILVIEKRWGGWAIALDRGLRLCSATRSRGLHGQKMDIGKRDQSTQESPGWLKYSECHWDVGATKQNSQMLAHMA